MNIRGIGMLNRNLCCVVAIAFGLILIPWSSSLGQTPKSATGLSDADIRGILNDRLDPKLDLGIIVGLIQTRSTRLVSAGKAGPGGVPALEGNTVFEIGSATKVFTASLLAEMVGRGELQLEDPVAKYLPATVRVPTRNSKQITLLDLVTHTSGLPRLPANLKPKDPNNPYADYTVEQMYTFLSGYELTRDIGAQFEYSNFGAGLLGHVLSLKAGMSYEALVTKRILEPLQMKDTVITLRPDLRPRLASGHDSSGGVVANWDLPTLAGAGALRSTMNDMLKFLAANLAGTGPLTPALRATHESLRSLGTPDGSIGLGWLLRRAFGAEIVWHNGGTGGYHSFIGFDPKTGNGVVVLHNSAASIDDIGFHLIHSQFPIAKPPAPPKPRTEVAINPSLLAAYVGEYQLAPTFTLTVTREGDQLFIQATGQSKLPVFPESEVDFFYKIVDAQVTFVKDAGGSVTSLVLHQGGRDTPGKKIK
jgi:D-alanyl-D-alanine-carboxypeptidase/D-alanyl-D-alanine-endopeptidase